ncbi:hypothetical protein X777_12249 [Ooceraea biroi]|uniref:Uncharacterized protein n=1 Tax=Ooceraea biroi TaxID=2015173 RepID=A0A026W1Q6_OOCBI|nr:hypothetical protein X777_12249 [Ooceraea biroi]
MCPISVVYDYHCVRFHTRCVCFLLCPIRFMSDSLNLLCPIYSMRNWDHP